jgi:arylsulfatase A-like enzyme
VKAHRFWIAAVSLTMAAGSSGCQRERDEAAPTPSPKPALAPSASVAAPTPEPPKRPPGPLNVLLITIDSLRADMPWTGYKHAIAPFLTELSKQSVVYTNAYSVSSYTAKSVGAILTGRYPSTTYRSGWFFTNFPAANRFFTEALQEKQIRTIGWHGHLYFGKGKGLEQGFDDWQLVPGITFNAQTDEHVTSDKMTKLGIELLGKPETSKGRFFAWAHYMDPHDEYKKHEETPDFGRNNRGRYDSEVFFTDLWIKKLVDWAEQQPWWKDTALIVSADHGEAFGEHGMYKHAFELWEVLIRVPLLVKAPGAAPKRIDLRRSHIDLAPTIMELLGQPPLDSFMGKTLVPEIYGAEEPQMREPILCEMTEDSHNPPRRAIISGDYKLIVQMDAGKHLLFDIAKDPGEEHDLAQEQPDKLKEMKALLQRTYEKLPVVEPYGGMTLKTGRTARGPLGPPKSADAGD